MNLHMLCEVRPRSEFFVAKFTAIGLFSCMRALVSDKVRALGKAFATALKGTNIGFVARMYTQVLLQRRIVIESSSANWAGIFFFSFHYYRQTSHVLCVDTVSYTHLRAHETSLHLVCRLLLEKKKKQQTKSIDILLLRD
eukprot:TRINITY_DN4317_c0_g1_i6.p2 TRINITY_DN4317_c0_g1~~TRINITY_DN4317_c0_g1_i6.p2  ORF type:complete len:140 (+),score=14.41 TRINITY_DN4317_c0_g1_i6:274-693(+)